MIALVWEIMINSGDVKAFKPLYCLLSTHPSLLVARMKG